MPTNTEQDLNNFFSGHLIINNERKIIFCNAYIDDLSGQPDVSLINSPISKFMTKASNIFIDSYIYPLLINESVAQEIQLTWVSQKGKKTPVIVNIKLGLDGLSYWSVYICANRDKLQSAWLKANEKLEKQSQELFRLATTDPLTGLLNRRELQAQAQKVIHQANRNSSTFALLAIDVDFFKRVNDTYGHQTGDKVLIHLAEVLTQERRVNDLVARIGGEEFVLILPDIEQKNAFLLAEKLRTNVEKKSIENMTITISIGLVVTQKNTQVDLDTLLQLADSALYDAKKTGRNRTSVAQL